MWNSNLNATRILKTEGVYYSLQIVHDPAYSKYSPGTLLEALELERCFSKGYKEYEAFSKLWKPGKF
jgi:GNAT acetyltransferase-like protein